VRRKANPTLVGVFVLGALALGLLALSTLGGLDLFGHRVRAVLYFDGAVRGLNVGSAVTFRGVQVGRVVAIRLHIDTATGESLVPVEIDIDPSIVHPLREEPGKRDPEQGLRNLVERGLKARLETQSILTGLLLVELEHLPGEPMRLVDLEGQEAIEIPTVPTLLQRLDRTLADLDLEKLASDVKSIVSGIEALVASPRLAETLDALPPAIEGYDALAQRLSATADDLALLVRDAHAVVLRVGQRAEPTFDRVDGVLQGIESAVAATGVVLDEGSTVAPELRSALRELGLAARSLRQLAELLERRPEVLLRGK
jgi:paraquat-inducible protein B